MTRLTGTLIAALLASIVAVWLGAATGITPASAQPPPSAPAGGGGVLDGCPGFAQKSCDLGEDALECAGNAKGCAEDAGKKVKDTVEDAGSKLNECRKKGLKECAKDAGGAVLSGGNDAAAAACNTLLTVACNGGKKAAGAATDCVTNPAECLSGAMSNLTTTVEGLGEILERIGNPLATLGSAIAEAVHNILITLCLAVWQAGLWVLKLVLTLGEMFLTPDLSGEGPGVQVYGVAMWLGLTLLFILLLLQLGVAVFKREGKQLGRVFIGLGQFAVIYFGWFLYCALMLIAAGGITKYLMDQLLGVHTWADWDLFDEWYNPIQGDIELAVAIVLAFMGLILWLAAIGHLLIYLGRAACLVVLAASGPISAAGLVLEFTKSWFWKTLRWFHAAAFTPALMVFVLGIGVQFATGVAAGLADSTTAVIATALPAVMIILISTVAPLALFKLFAFADPGTPSGAAFRQGLALQGGFTGLLSGGGSGGGDQASKADSKGKSAGETSAEGTTNDRFSKSTQGLLGSLGPAGQGLAQGWDTFQKLGAQATALTTDVSNQAGIGQHTYGPDFGNNPQQGGTRSAGGNPDDGGPPPDNPPDNNPEPPPPPAKPPLPPAPAPQGPPKPPSQPSGGGSKAPGGGAGGAGGGGGGTPPPDIPPPV